MSAKRLPYMPFYVADWLADAPVREMSAEAKGAYIDMLAFEWQDGPISSDPAVLARMTGARPDTIKREVLPRFKRQEDGRLRHEKLERVRTAQLKALVAASEHGARAAEARWNARALPAHSPTDARAMPSESESESESENQQPAAARRKKPRATHAIRDRHAYYLDTRFKALLALWPVERWGSKSDKEAAFACWEGQGEVGKARIESEVRRVAGGDAMKLGAFAELVIGVAHVVHAPPADAPPPAGKLSPAGKALLDRAMGKPAAPPALAGGGAP